ncbi:MAG: sensor histidine kinase [Bacillus sp. (in: firmicutes)]
MLEKWKEFKIFPKKFGFYPYIFLVYLIMPFYGVLMDQGWKKAAGIGLLILFLVTYRQLYHSFDHKSYTVWLLIQIGIIAILAVFYNHYNLLLGFFATYFIGLYQDKQSFYTVMTWFTFVMILLTIIHWDQLELFSAIFTVIMLITPFGVRSMGRQMELEQKLNEANEQIQELVKRDERMRIARDLHDTLGHTLSMITLKSQLVHKLISKDSEKAKLEAKEIEKTSRSALSQVRELVSDLRASTLAEELIETETILQTAGITFRFEGDSRLEGVPLLTQNILSLCLKEGITNVVKHSQASVCHIVIVESEGEIELSVHDNGIGLDGSTIDGNGLKGMNERLRLIDGSMTIISQKGTKLMIKVPLIVKEKKAGVGT